MAVEIGLIMLIDYTSLGNRIFETAPIQWRVWLLMLPMVACMFWLEEARKWLARSKPRKMMGTVYAR